MGVSVIPGSAAAGAARTTREAVKACRRVGAAALNRLQFRLSGVEARHDPTLAAWATEQAQLARAGKLERDDLRQIDAIMIEHLDSKLPRATWR